MSLLPPPRRYFPIENGRYEVKPGLRKFTGEVFEIDSDFEIYRRSKQAARAEDLSKYCVTADLSHDVERAVCLFIANRLSQEHPAFFTFDGQVLHSTLTGDTLQVCADGIDALGWQVQEDIAVTSSEEGRHWLSALHLCSPNHWAAQEKIGKTFDVIHEPVAEIEAISRRADDWVRTMIAATDGLMRFAWGIATDRELNHHPHRPAGRRFDRENPCAFLRVERQTMGISSGERQPVHHSHFVHRLRGN